MKKNEMEEMRKQKCYNKEEEIHKIWMVFIKLKIQHFFIIKLLWYRLSAPEMKDMKPVDEKEEIAEELVSI